MLKLELHKITCWLALAFMAYIALTNQSFPRHDAADYLSISYKIISQTAQNGLSSLPENLYRIRNWKPIIVPSTIAIFSTFLDYDLLLGAKIHNLFFLVIAFFYFFRLSRLLTGSAPQSLIVASSVILFSGSLDLLCVYTAEIVQLACSAGFLVHYLSKDNSKTDYGLAIFWACFGLLARPAEILMFIFVIVLYEMWKSYKKSPLLSLVAILCFSVFTVGLYHCLIENLPDNSLLLVSSVLAVLILFFKKRINFFLHLYVAAQISSTLWYWSYFNQVSQWVWTSSVGTAARLTGQRGSMSSLSFVLRIFEVIGSAEFAILILIYGLLVIFLGYQNRHEKNIKSLFDLRQQDFLIIFTLCTPIFIGTFGANADLRYYITIVLLFSVYIYSKLIKSLSRHQRSQKIILSGFFITLFAWQAYHFILFDQAKSSAYLYGSYNKFSRYSTSQDPVFKFVDQLAENENLKGRSGLRINSIDWLCRSDISTTIDVWPLRVLLHEKGLDWAVDRVLIFNEKTREDRLHKLKTESDFVIVGPMDNCWAVYDNSNPVSELTEYLVDAFKKNTLQETGFEFKGLIPGYGRDGVLGHFILLKTVH